MTENLSTPTDTVKIRNASREDLPEILDLVRELARYEKAPEKVTATLETYQDAYDHGYFEALVAEKGGSVVGMALYYKTFSTWKGRMMHLEDFVVQENSRGTGIGKMLFEAFIAAARDVDSVMCKWQVLDWNEPAINFYKKYPVVFDGEWLDVKLYF